MSKGIKIKTPRLLKAAKEFNIGRKTLLDFLKEKGFKIKGFKPTSKLSEEMYLALQEEFEQDKATKSRSEAIDLHKGFSLDDIDKSKEELDLGNPKKDLPEKEVVKEKAEVKETPTEEAEKKNEIITPIDEEEKKADKEAKAVMKEPTEASKTKEQPSEASSKDEASDEKVKDKSEDKNESEDKGKQEEDNIGKIKGLKVLEKINLEELNLSTRPKKKSKQEKETQKAKEKEKEKSTTQKKKQETSDKTKKKKPEKKETPKPPTDQKGTSQEKKKEDKPTPEHIETKSPKLPGTKVVKKIDLPEESKGNKNGKHKRKRKRIPVDKKKRKRNTLPQGKRGDKTARRGKKHRKNKKIDQLGQEIDSKEIQEKIKETQAKLSGGGFKNKNLKAKYRRNKREERAEKRRQQEAAQDDSVIEVTEFISVNEFANLLGVSFTDVISKCMSLGIMVSINQRLDAEVIELVASEFDKEVAFIDLEDNSEDEEDDVVEVIDDEEDLEPRAPVMTIMGHVDHGKTSLLDYIRKESVVAGEAGGITQHIGAYRVTMDSGKSLTFLDTPGHEAFTAMRARGAKAADIAIIIIAADDAVMPQTREAISHAQAAGLPMVFAFNKIDKEGANPEKIKEQLSAMNILVEDWGGDYQSQEISAKKGLHIDDLLEKIILQAELLELKANPNKKAVGSVIEASLDKGRGYVSTLLIQGGTLHQGAMVLSGQYYGKIKAMYNERGQRISEAGPSTPVQVLGLNGAPKAGEKFKIYGDESEAKSLANRRGRILREQGLRSQRHITLDEIGRRLALGNFQELNIIIKADYDGSAEALSDSLQKLSTEEVVVNVVLKGVGQISESDVMLASASDAIILGFQVRPSVQAARLADEENIEIRQYSVIYEAKEEIRSAMEGLLAPKIERQVVGNLEVRQTFKISKVGTIAGCYVKDGKITRNTKINVIREGIVIHTGELASLKRYKDDVKDVSAGYECGLNLKGFNDIKEGDILEGFEEIEVKRKL